MLKATGQAFKDVLHRTRMGSRFPSSSSWIAVPIAAQACQKGAVMTVLAPERRAEAGDRVHSCSAPSPQHRSPGLLCPPLAPRPLKVIRWPLDTFTHSNNRGPLLTRPCGGHKAQLMQNRQHPAHKVRAAFTLYWASQQSPSPDQ